MIPHGFVDIQISRRWSIKASQQLIYHDQQFHLFRLLDKLFLDLFFKCLRVFPAQHLHVNLVLLHGLGFAVVAYGFGTNITCRRLVRRNDGAFSLQLGLLKQLIEFTSLVDATSNQHSISTPIVQARLCFHIKDNIRYDLSKTSLGAKHLLQIAPSLF